MLAVPSTQKWSLISDTKIQPALLAVGVPPFITPQIKAYNASPGVVDAPSGLASVTVELDERLLTVVAVPTSVGWPNACPLINMRDRTAGNTRFTTVKFRPSQLAFR